VNPLTGPFTLLNLATTVLNECDCGGKMSKIGGWLRLVGGSDWWVASIIAINCWLKHHDLPPPVRTQRYEHEIEIHEYHQRRNLQALKSHTKTRYHKLRALGIEPDKIKRCQPRE